jgi:hypothetical protein
MGMAPALVKQASRATAGVKPRWNDDPIWLKADLAAQRYRVPVACRLSPRHDRCRGSEQARLVTKNLCGKPERLHEAYAVICRPMVPIYKIATIRAAAPRECAAMNGRVFAVPYPLRLGVIAT